MTDATQLDEGGLQELVRPGDYRQRPEVAGKFPSDAALLWFIRRYRRRLVDAGALVMLTNRLYLRPAVADRAILQIGIETARGEVTADAS
jgi:hypothetical protein